MELTEKYGPWAVVVGGSTGLGAGMATQAAKAGMNVALVARRAALLEECAAELTRSYGIEVRTAVADVGEPDATCEAVTSLTSGLTIGLLAYNAAIEEISPFLDISWNRHLAEVMGNCVTPMRLSYDIASQMVKRGKGAIILISSLSAIQGSILTVGYGATKAFEWILAEGLWAELHPKGLDVVGVLLGATATPSLLEHGVPVVPMTREEMERADPGLTLQNRLRNATPPMEAAEYIFSQLGKGPTIFSDPIDERVARKLLSLPRKDAVKAMVDNMQSATPGSN